MFNFNRFMNEPPDEFLTQLKFATSKLKFATKFYQKILDEELLCKHVSSFLIADDNKYSSIVYSSYYGAEISLYCFAPSKLLNRDYWTIITVGISRRRMYVPDHILCDEDPEDLQHVELMCYLPSSWILPKTLGIHDDNHDISWPFYMLRSIGAYIINTDVWISYNHGIPNLLSDPPGLPYTFNTHLSHVFLLEPCNENPTFGTILINDIRINFLLAVPITNAEAVWKRKVGCFRSIYYLIGSKIKDNAPIDYCIDSNRSCCVEQGWQEIIDALNTTDEAELSTKEEEEEVVPV